MTLDEIKQALEVNTGTFPRLALEQAIERREETVPWLLDTWREAADAPESLVSKGNDYILHIYAMYLLAQFREPAAYPDMVRPNNVQSRLSIGKEATLQAMKEKYHFIRDAIVEMEWWACFRSEQNSLLRALPIKSPPQHSTIPSNAKVGRNDPCPCGSGKKYKKCCLN